MHLTDGTTGATNGDGFALIKVVEVSVMYGIMKTIVCYLEQMEQNQ